MAKGKDKDQQIITTAKRQVIAADAPVRPITTRRNIPAEAKETQQTRAQERARKTQTKAQKAQTDATKKQTKATGKHVDVLKKMEDQFKQMHQDLDALQGASKEQTDAIKKQTIEDKKDYKVQIQGVKDRKTILKNIQIRLKKTMTEAAAEHLAAGGGIIGAGKAALGLRKEQAGYKYDPLNIVKRLTGGSKLAVSLAGKALGRERGDIEHFAELAPPETRLPTRVLGKGKAGTPTQERGTGTFGVDAVPLLDKMSSTLGVILTRLTAIERFEALSVKIAQDHFDHVRDEASEDKARFKSKSPAQQTKTGDKTSLLDATIKKMVDWFKNLGGVVAGFASSLAGMLPTIGAVGAGLLGLLSPLKNIVTSLGKTLLSGISAAGSAVMKGGAAVLSGAKKMLGLGAKDAVSVGEKALEGPAAKAGAKVGAGVAAKVAKPVAGAAASLGAKLSETVAGKVASSSKTAGVLGSVVPKFAGKVLGKVLPGVGLALAANDLAQGNYVSGAINGIIGGASLVPGIGTGASIAMAATGVLAEIVNSAYGDLYKDEQGNPMNPITDPDRGPRMLALTKEASTALADAFTKAPAPTPESAPQTAPMLNAEGQAAPEAALTTVQPTEVPAPAPTTGMKLTQAADFQKNAATGLGTAPSGNMIINNVKNNNSSVTNVQNGLASARSEESSYLRSADRSWSPA